MRVVLASGNAGKLRELQALLAPSGLVLTAQSELGIETPPETGATFAENALLKARHVARLAGMPALADDSGLEVDALGGRPGVYSARYAGEGAGDEENLRKLLDELRDVPEASRTARFHCVITLVRDAQDPAPLVAHGTWEGHIARQPRGGNGFGYDPVFVPNGLACSAGELEPAEKNRLSHRGQALRELAARLRTARS